MTLRQLQEKNRERSYFWTNGPMDVLWCSNELAGETGEVCNVVKKLERERRGIKGSRATAEQLAEELGDVVICASLLANSYGIDLEKAVKDKFNKTSASVGLPVTIE
jgi:NTP pyrophosphatase (non-canonical NTP hydrolase)